ncbi:unnamed protein product, partial [Rotaria sordida]
TKELGIGRAFSIDTGEMSLFNFNASEQCILRYSLCLSSACCLNVLRDNLSGYGGFDTKPKSLTIKKISARR